MAKKKAKKAKAPEGFRIACVKDYLKDPYSETPEWTTKKKEAHVFATIEEAEKILTQLRLRFEDFTSRIEPV